MHKRYISILLAVVLTLSLTLINLSTSATSAPLTREWEFGGSGDLIVEGSSAIDILINAGLNSDVLAGDVQDLIYEYVKQYLAEKGHGETGVRIILPKKNISTRDLSEWYVYDHYDSKALKNTTTPAWSAPSNQGDNWTYTANASSNGTPLASTKDESSNPPKLTPEKGYSADGLPQMYIADWVNGTYEFKNINGQTFNRPHNASSYPSADTLGAFDRHILSHDVEKGGKAIPTIDFVGYATKAYQDFLFYPVTSTEEKIVTFEIDTNAVNPHTLDGAGFLINAGVDESGKMKGYLLYYAFVKGSATPVAGDEIPGSVTLYKLDGSFTPELLNNDDKNTTSGNQGTNVIAVNSFNNDLTGIGKLSKVDGASMNLKKLDSSNRPRGDLLVDWATQMEIRLVIGPTKLTVEQRPLGTNDWDKVIDVDNLALTGQHGFGPYVGYNTHGCVRASQFTFANVEMAYINQSDMIFDVLSDANYLQNSNKYFVDLTDDGENRGLGDDEQGKDAAAYMQVNEIDYITNNPSDTNSYSQIINPNAPKGEPEVGEGGVNGNNGLDLAGITDPDALAQKIAEYIVNSYLARQENGYERPENGKTLALTFPVAILRLVDNLTKAANNDSTAYITEVRRDLIKNGEKLTIYGYDEKSYPSSKTDEEDPDIEIKSYNYTITYPSGDVEVIIHDNPNGVFENGILFKITNNSTDWPTGKYSVELTVTDTSDKTSKPVRVDFTIVEDTVAPVVPTAVIDTENKNLSFTVSDLGGYGVVGWELEVTSGSAITIAQTGRLASTETAASRTDSINIEGVSLPEGEYTMKLIVYDMAGNKTVVNLPTIDYVNEMLIGLKPGTNDTVNGVNSPDGTIDIDPEWFGADKGYKTVNDTFNKDDTALMRDNVTNVTIGIPDRPSAPDSPIFVLDENGNGFIMNVDGTMEYKPFNSEYYQNAGSDSEIWTTDDDYFIRLKAVPGESFASYDKKLGQNGDVYYTVAFNTKGGLPVPETQYVLSGSTADEPYTDPEQAKYRFDGWYADEDCIIPWYFSDSITQSRTLYAKWTQVEFDVAIQVVKDNEPWIGQVINIIQDGQIVGTATVDEYGRIEFTVPSSGTYTFIAEDTAEGLTLFINEDLLSESLVYYTVTFETYGGTSVPENQYVLNGGLATKPTVDPVKAGYEFVDWYTDPECKTPWKFGEDTISETVTIYAKWTKVAFDVSIQVAKDNKPWIGHTVNIMQNGRIVGSATVDNNGKIKFTGLSSGTYTFISEGATEGLSLFVGEDHLSESLSYYTVTFETYGGTPVPGNQYVLKGGLATRPTVKPVHGELHFVSWYADTKCETPWVFGKDTVSKPVTIYAKWREVITYAVSGVVVYSDNTPVPNSKVEVFLGAEKIGGPVYTNSLGEFTVPGIPSGIYNLVVTSPDGDTDTCIKTVFIDVQNANLTIIEPVVLDGQKNTIVAVENDSITPAIVVNGLSALLNSENISSARNGEADENGVTGITQEDLDIIANGGALEIVLSARGFNEQTAGYANSIKTFDTLAKNDNRQVKLFIDLFVDKYLWDRKADYQNKVSPDYGYSLTHLPELITVYVPLDGSELDGETDLTVYRIHNGSPEEMQRSPMQNLYGECYDIVGNKVMLTVRRFSEFAIARTLPVSNPAPTDNSSSNQVSNNNSHKITLQTGSGNGTVTISNKNPYKGLRVTVTVKPDNGYELDTLTITDSNGNIINFTDNGDGTYYYYQPDSDITIDATFKAITPDADSETSGDPKAKGGDVSGLLNTDDHLLFMVGRDDSKFAADANITRAESVRMFYNLLRNKNVSATSSFPDVPENKWYTSAIDVLSSLKIITGFPDGSFYPDENITRAQFAVIAVRFAAISPGDASFNDVPSTHWAYDYIKSAANFGWVTGMGNGFFEPERNITRAEAATVVNKMLGRYPDKEYIDSHSELNIFNDLEESHWGYYEIIEATASHDFNRSNTSEVWKSFWHESLK